MSDGTILVVDDTTESLRLLVDVLTSEGYRVRPADSGPLALASARVDPPDLILLDIRMPIMDGYEVCSRLKSDEATDQIPIIFISAATEVSDRVHGLTLGAVDYITKPFQREELLARVRTHLELGRLRASLERQVAERTAELNDANEQLCRNIEFQRKFLRDVLASVTDGTLILCYNVNELPEPLTPCGVPVDLSSAAKLRELREATREAAGRAGLSGDRTFDMITGVNEAGMNSIVHVGAGTAFVSIDVQGGREQVRIEDHGPGITLEHLPQAALMKGYTTAGTFGHGMKMMISLVDHIFLLTGPSGTTVVLEQERERRQDRWPAAGQIINGMGGETERPEGTLR